MIELTFGKIFDQGYQFLIQILRKKEAVNLD